MENSPNGATAAEVAGVDLQEEERPRVRRRLVQSTLFPHKFPEIVPDKVVGDCDEEDVSKEEEEENRWNRGKKKRKGKPRSSKKLAVNGKGILSKREGKEDSPPIVKSDAILQTSQEQHPKQEQQCVVSPESNERICFPVESATNVKSPRQLKRRVNSTPKKKQTQTPPKKYIKNVCLKETCLDQISDIQSGNSTLLVPDLRLEEKMKAEEDARIFGGRQIHPFFSSTKMTKNIKETTHVERHWCSDVEKDKCTNLSPIHVFEMVQDDAVSLDWANWVLSESSFISSHYDLKTACPPVSQGSANPLHFDDFLILCPRRTSLLQSDANRNDVLSLDESPVAEEHRNAVLATSADEPAVLNEELESDWQGHWHAGHIGNSDVDRETRFLHKRMKTYYHGCGNHPVNSLWTNKYLPEKAIEVCGNEEAVSFLSEWLRLWHERGFRSSKDLSLDKNFTVHDDGYDSYQSDSDSGNGDEDDSLKNVLLVTGPVGSGKSAAIYACAKEQGFHVIEVSASDWRTRALVMQRFEGGVESHSVQRIHQTPLGTETKQLISKLLPVTPCATAVQGSDNEVSELIHLPDEEEDSPNSTGTLEKFVSNAHETAMDQTTSKPLILFEDVDAILSEDHGLIATIQKLAETAKRPIILTSNNHNPVLPNNLDRLELCFAKGSLKELLCHLHMVCAAEKAKVQHCLVERLIGCCHRDIRKTLMHLQFWSQGQRCRKDSKEQGKYGPLLFDLDAGHQILPKIIPPCHSSQLAEIVEKEITNSSSMVEERSKLTEVIVEGDPSKNAMQKQSNRHKSETDGIEVEAKKEAILRRHFPLQDGNEIETQFITACESSSSSGSPIAFTRRSSRRKLDTVVSFGSGSESLNNKFPVINDEHFEDTNNRMLLEVDSKSPSCWPATGLFFSPVPEQILNSKVAKLEEFSSLCSESALYTQIDGTRKSVDVSCMPELSFVPETEVDDGTSLFNRTVSSPHDTDIVEAVSTFKYSMLNMQAVETNDHHLYVSGLHNNNKMIENFHVHTDSAHEEEVGDSNNEHVGVVPRGYPVMDECSRMDFSMGIKSMEKLSSCVLIDSVQETWRRIRGSGTNLRQYVTLEEKNTSQILKVAYGMCNLISEADVLLGDCHLLLHDSLEPPTVPNENTHSFSWYDDQLWMTSTIAQHGICLYTKEIAAVGSSNASVNNIDLAIEMLASSSNTMALGKLVNQDMKVPSCETGPLKGVLSAQSKLDSHICSVIQSIVPSRLYLWTKGDASYYEYLSSLGRISRLEAFRLSKNSNNSKQKRIRVSRNYLSTGSLLLSSDDISLLGQYHCYGKASPQSMDAG